jgi:hypothetical protein
MLSSGGLGQIFDITKMKKKKAAECNILLYQKSYVPFMREDTKFINPH